MPGTYHILPAHARYTKMRVPCYQTGRYHRHRFCDVERVMALCGATVESGRDDGCNIIIANPNWDKDWCHNCVGIVPWTEPAGKIWQERHGIETLSVEEWQEQHSAQEGNPKTG